MKLHGMHFEWGVIPPDLTPIGSPEVSTDQARSGTRSLKIPAAYAEFGQGARIILASTLSEMFVQIPYYPLYAPPTAEWKIIRWQAAGGAVLGGLTWGVDKKIRVYTGDFAALVGISATTQEPNAWNVLELHLKIADSGGIIILRKDLNEEANFIGDTKPGADTAVAVIVVGSLYGGGGSPCAFLDDVILHDTTGSQENSWPNGGRIALLRPNADGDVLQMTPTPGPEHYTAIDESPPSGTDNLQAATTALEDETELTNLPPEAASVASATVEIYGFKGSSSSPTRAALGLNVGGTVGYSPDLDLPLAQGLVKHLFWEKPGGGAFSVADANGMKLRLKAAA